MSDTSTAHVADTGAAAAGHTVAHAYRARRQRRSTRQGVGHRSTQAVLSLVRDAFRIRRHDAEIDRAGNSVRPAATTDTATGIVPAARIEPRGRGPRRDCACMRYR
jgi:hypothetical protein